MSTKGDDLEFRVPQTSATTGPERLSRESELRANGSRFRPRSGQRPSTVWVDQTLIQCKGHAYEVASAHGAAEVMLEHLIYALTRVPEAAAVLETRGVHVAALRRESAAIISSDIPLAVPSASAKVNASGDFEMTILGAASHARQRGGEAAEVRDVLLALLDTDRQGAASDLLKRHWPTWRQEEAAERRLARPVLPEPALSDRVYAPGPGRTIEDRLAGLETGLMSISGELQRERGTVAELVGGLRTGIAEQRMDAQGHVALVGDRLARLEKTIETARLGSNIDLEGQLGPRLSRIEKMQETLLAQRASLANIESVLGERLQRLELAIESAARTPSGLGERLAGIERTVEGRIAEATHAALAAGDRVGRLEKAIELLPAAIPGGLAAKLESVERAIEQRLAEGARSAGGITERLIGLERSLTAQRAEIAHVQTAVTQDLEALIAAASEPTQAVVTPELIETQMRELTRALESHRADIVGRLPGDLGQRFAALDQGLAARLEDSQRGLNALSVKLGELEATVGSVREDMTGLSRQYDGDRGEMRNAEARLNGAQQTLSAAVDQWRQDNAARLNGLATSLTTLERASTRPAELLEGMTGRLDILRGEVQQVTQVQRASIRQRGFWRWLFGLR